MGWQYPLSPRASMAHKTNVSCSQAKSTKTRQDWDLTGRRQQRRSRPQASTNTLKCGLSVCRYSWRCLCRHCLGNYSWFEVHTGRYCQLHWLREGVFCLYTTTSVLSVECVECSLWNWSVVGSIPSRVGIGGLDQPMICTAVHCFFRGSWVKCRGLKLHPLECHNHWDHWQSLNFLTLPTSAFGESSS